MMGELLLQGGGVQLLVAFAGGSGKLEEQQPEEEEELCTTNSSSSSHWYFTKDQIDNNSPSRRDGIDLKKENYLRKSYCTFLQDLGMRLKEPQLTIATAIVFCHRFFLRQSHHKNDCHLIATVCMFLAGKVEDSPRPLQDVILMSYEIRFKKDPIAVQKIKQKHVFEAEKERVLLGEWLVLTTLGFDFNVHHPYKPLGSTLRKLGMAKHPLAQVAWNFVNDGLRTSLCLQYKPHHVAAGAIFLATKFLKIKLTSEGDKLWWQEFEVTPRQLEVWSADVSNQMLELYEQDKKGMSSQMSDPSSSTGPNTPRKGTASTDLPDVAGCPCPVLPPGQMKPELLEDKKKYCKIVEAVTGDMTEAHSSLEEGENMAESKPATFEIPGTAAFLTNTSRTSSKGMLGSAARGMPPDNMENKLQTSHRELPALEQHDAKYPADVAEEEKHMDQEAMVYGRVDLQLQGMKSEPAVRGDSDHMDAVGGGQGNAISRGICKLEWTCVAKQDYNMNIASGIVVYEFMGVRKMQVTKQGTDLSGHWTNKLCCFHSGYESLTAFFIWSIPFLQLGKLE